MAEILEPRSRKRELAAILHAAVVGFSRLMGEDEAGTHRALGELRRAVDPLITAQGGRIVRTAGDNLLTDFPSVVDGLNCAVEMQRGQSASSRHDCRDFGARGRRLGRVAISGGRRIRVALARLFA